MTLLHIFFIGLNIVFTYCNFTNDKKLLKERYNANFILMGYNLTNGLTDLMVAYMIWFMLDSSQATVVQDHTTGVIYPKLNNLTTGTDSLLEDEFMFNDFDSESESSDDDNS